MKCSVSVLVAISLAVVGACSSGESETTPAPASTRQDATVDHDSATHGALQVMSVDPNPGDWFDVLEDGRRALAGNPPLLNQTIELPPGSYQVEVNRTRRAVTIAAGRKAVLWTGALLVEGQPETAYWYPIEGEERTLALNPPLLNRSRDLFPGTYRVFVHESVGVPDRDLGTAEVLPGHETILKY